MKIAVIQKRDLSFNTSHTSMNRENEKSQLVTAPQHIVKVVRENTQLIDQRFLPDQLKIELEENALISGPGHQENIPISLVLSQQLRAQNKIILGMWELSDARK